MHSSIRQRAFAGAIVALVTASGLGAGGQALADPAAAVATPEQYKPYEFLIGSWDFAVAGKPPIGLMDFTWGPNRSYILYQARTRNAQGELAPHFQGIIVWNGLHENLDTLVMLDMANGKSQEAGTFAVQSDGSVLRDILATSSKTSLGPAVVGHFQNTFTRDGDAIKAVLRRQTKDGWTTTFPGSDSVVMTRAQ